MHGRSKAQVPACERRLLGSNSPNHVPHAVEVGGTVHLDGLFDWRCRDSPAWVRAVAPVDGRATFTAQGSHDDHRPSLVAAQGAPASKEPGGMPPWRNEDGGRFTRARAHI
jgi:hypothetical protein